MGRGRSVIRAMNDFGPGKPLGLRVQSVVSSLVIGLCALAWVALVVLAVYVPVYGMALGVEGGGESQSMRTAERIGKWLDGGGWRIVAPVLLVVSIGAVAWRLVTVVRLYRAGRRAQAEELPPTPNASPRK